MKNATRRQTKRYNCKAQKKASGRITVKFKFKNKKVKTLQRRRAAMNMFNCKNSAIPANATGGITREKPITPPNLPPTKPAQLHHRATAVVARTDRELSLAELMNLGLSSEMSQSAEPDNWGTD